MKTQAMKSFKQGTIDLSKLADIQAKFEAEVLRLLSSGAVEPESHNRGLLFGVALENVADGWLRGERKTKEYRNLKHF